MNRLHERCLGLSYSNKQSIFEQLFDKDSSVYSDKQSTFEQLFDKDSSVPIHIRNLETLATEMYEVVNGSSPLNHE